MIRGRLRRRRGAGDRGEAQDDVIELNLDELSGLFSPPGWLRDAGFSAWLLAGVILLAVGITWILSLTHVIFVPLMVAVVIAAVAGPLVSWLKRHGVPRGLGAALVLLAIVLAGSFAAYLVLAGVTSEASGITDRLTSAAGKIQGWLEDIGVSEDKAQRANDDVSQGASDSFHALLSGAASGVRELSSLVFFLAMTVLSLFFLLKDGPTIRAWTEQHMGVPRTWLAPSPAVPSNRCAATSSG